MTYTLSNDLLTVSIQTRRVGMGMPGGFGGGNYFFLGGIGFSEQNIVAN